MRRPRWVGTVWVTLRWRRQQRLTLRHAIWRALRFKLAALGLVAVWFTSTDVIPTALHTHR